MLIVPGVFALGALVLVALGISGTSSGVYWDIFGSGPDPALLAGEPRAIRSDEWLVQSSWIVSQAQQGFPVVNRGLPGGMDATIQNDLPTVDWSSAFRPHVLGFLVLPLDSGMAVRWLLPALAVLISGYWLLVSLVPSSPGAATLLASSVLLSPIVQWWFLPTTLWPIAFAFLAATATVWGFRSSRAWQRWVFAAATGYVAVTMVMSIYVPFMVPAIIAAVVFTLGWTLMEVRTATSSAWRTVISGIGPLIASALAAIGVVGIWIATRLETVEAVTSTVYPGERLEPTGTAATSLSFALAHFSAPFQRSLLAGVTDALAPNASEASAPLMIVVFLLPAMIWASVARAKSGDRSTDYVLLALIGGVGVGLAFFFLPGWDGLAHLLFIDRTTQARMRLIFLILGIMGTAALIRRLSMINRRVPWSIVGLTLVAGLASTVITSAWLAAAGSQVVAASRAWIPTTALMLVAIAAVGRRMPLVAGLSVLLSSAIVGLGVNPAYLGVFDLRATEIGRVVMDVERARPSADWVGIGGSVPTAVLIETGAGAFNGVQTYPPREMWQEIDPAKAYEFEWNRLANVSWTPGDGPPSVTNPARDQIVVTFDSCSPFAQASVDFVLSDAVIEQSCLTEVEVVSEGASTMIVYSVKS